MKCFNGAQAARLFMNVQGWQQVGGEQWLAGAGVIQPIMFEK